MRANCCGDAADALGQKASEGSFSMPRGLTLLTFLAAGEYRLGVKTGKGVLDAKKAAQALGLPAPDDMDDLLQSGKGDMLAALVQAAQARDLPGAWLDENSLTFGPLVARPEKILMVGLNYRRHAKETKSPLPESPLLFNKYNNALSAHGSAVPLPTRVAHRFDYEVELVIVLGKGGFDIPPEQALAHVAGYAVGNDISARDLQKKGSQWMIGKTCDGFAPVGPYLVCADLVENPDALALECRVNGQTCQSSNTNDMIFDCKTIISYASSLMTLKPGDLIFTGTPEGVILGRPYEQRQWLKPGDEVACSVEKLGELRFTFKEHE